MRKSRNVKVFGKNGLKVNTLRKKELKSKRVEKILTIEEELERKLIRIEIQNMIRSLSVPGKYYSLHKPKQER